MIRTIRQVGFEIEYFVGKDGQPVLASRYGLPHDEFPILGEARGEPGKTPEEAAANLLCALMRAERICRQKGLELKVLSYMDVDPKLYTQALIEIGHKEVHRPPNLYGTDINLFDDRIIEEGRFVGARVSAGLHVHFSLTCTDSETVRVVTPQDGLMVAENREVKLSASLITRPVVEAIVRAMDRVWLPKLRDWPDDVYLRHRLPGMWERKDHGGFEYRSLPANQTALDSLLQIAEFTFGLLDKALNFSAEGALFEWKGG